MFHLIVLLCYHTLLFYLEIHLFLHFDASPCLLFYALVLLDYYSPPSLPFFHIGLGMVNFKLSFQSLVGFSSFIFFLNFFKKNWSCFWSFFHFVYMFCLLSLHCCFPPPLSLFLVNLLEYVVSCAKVFVYWKKIASYSFKLYTFTLIPWCIEVNIFVNVLSSICFVLGHH